MRPTGKLGLALLLLLSLSSFGQSRNAFFIQFSHKGTTLVPSEVLSQLAIDRRTRFNVEFDSTDHPVNPDFIEALTRDSSIHLRYALKWSNAIVVDSDLPNIDSLTRFPFVLKVAYVGKVPPSKPRINPAYRTPVLKLKENEMDVVNAKKDDYGKTYDQNKQIGVLALHKQGYDGTGIYAAVFDAGFYNLNKIPAFLKHQSHGRIVVGEDLVDLDREMFDRDNHGTAVSSSFAGYDRGKYIGSAPNVKIVFFRTENGQTEYPIEELNWCKAAELADSLGVDMITSSLGYNQYDDKTLSYTHADLNGRTSYVSLAARTAVHKGIFVLNSAGNEGNDDWYKIGTPADVPEVLTIGAVDINNTLGQFSSRGNNADGHIKPDVCALGVKANVASTYGSYYQGYGTSYATPIAAGGVACVLQALPNESPERIAEAIRMSATHNSAPDSLQGYGVAQMDVAVALIKAQNAGDEPSLIKYDKDRLTIYNQHPATVMVTIQTVKRKWLIFKIKERLLTFSQTSNVPITYVDLSDISVKCIKKYTIKVEINSDVDNHSFKIKDLKLCSD